MSEQLEVEDFDTAKIVFEKLKDVPLERRRRILTWVAEGLGVVLQAASLAPPIPLQHTPVTSASLPGHSPQSQPTDIKTFVATKAPKSDVQFSATVAYYYRFEAPAASRRDTIDGDTLKEAARLVGRSRLGNPRVTLNNAKNLGYLDGNSPGEFSINSVGENLVAMTLPGPPDGGGKAKRTRATKAKRAKKKTGRKR
jgi:hypothetical protein